MMNKFDINLSFIVCYILFFKFILTSGEHYSFALQYSIKFIDNINIIPNERQALYDLYTSTNGNDWIYQEGDKGKWNFTDPYVNPCLPSNIWQGLNCTIVTTLSNSYYYVAKIILSKYNLTGNIPDSIGNFSQLQYLDLSYNYIKKKMPNTIGNLSELVQLDISYNSLSGTIPNAIYQLLNLQVLNLDNNYYLKGTLSNLIGQLSQLKYLNLKNNSLTGTIPYSIGNLSSLTFLRISFNQLSGTITHSIKHLKNLTLLYLSNNQLTGTIPYWIGELKLLKYFSLRYNNINGTIPSTLSKLVRLDTCMLDYNLLTGTIPDWIGNLSSLAWLCLGNNDFSSTVPSSLFSLTQLVTLVLSDNQLTGTLPDVINALKLNDIELNDNHFTGSIPSAFSTIVSLATLYLHNNHFTGNLNEVFNGSYQKQLNNIQLDNNQFTGKLPEDVFLSGKLALFSAVSNCFRGSIPTSICDNTNLNTLALDGLVCASSCRNKIFPWISSAYLSDNEITGGIPHCLWSMPKLQVLHLSGNGLTGSLPDNLEISNSLINLALSYNMLTGSIPSNIHHKAWKNIDLSHNRFSGSLIETSTNQSSNASLSLNNNRLSGFIPHSLKYMKDIDILKGNSFACKYDRSDVPIYDNHKDTYECGSNSFNAIYYIWLGILTVIIIIVSILWYSKNQLEIYLPIKSMGYNIWKWLYMLEYLETHCGNEDNVVKKMNIMNYFKQYNALIEMMFRFSWYCTVCIIVILLPTYCVLSYYFCTHTHEYAWTVSIVYLSGVIAFVVTISILLLFIIMQILLFMYTVRRSNYDIKLKIIEDSSNNNITNKNNNKWKIYSMYIIYIAINLIIISGVNTAYVLVALYRSNFEFIMATIAIAIFKIVWNSIISAMILRQVIEYLAFINTSNQAFQRRLFIMQLCVSLLNNILIPCFIVAIISPNCFYNVFVQEADVTATSFFYQSNCLVMTGGVCIKYTYDKLNTSYSPPFTYSYQCSAGFITYYAPVFIFICIISTFITPLIELFLVQLSTKYTWIIKFLQFRKLFLPINNEITPPLIYRDQIYTFFVSQLTLIALLVTFGAIFPPLAVALLISIGRRLYSHKVILARYIVKAIELKVYSCLDIIEEDCKVIPSFLTIRRCGFIILSTSSIFYTLFLFDILGDKVGLNKAYWVLIVMPSIPICMYVVYRLYFYWLKYIFEIEAEIFRNNRLISAASKYELKDIYKNDIELTTTTSVLTTSNPLIVMNTTINTTKEDGRDIIIRDLSVSEREDISIITV